VACPGDAEHGRNAMPVERLESFYDAAHWRGEKGRGLIFGCAKGIFGVSLRRLPTSCFVDIKVDLDTPRCRDLKKRHLRYESKNVDKSRKV
jgi:hypothetical protein